MSTSARPPARSPAPVLTWGTSLIRYIDTYRDPHAEVAEEEEEEPKKKPWWKGGGAAGTGKKFSDFVTPTDWLNTEMRDGLNTMEVERRRKSSGWNELSAEKENMVCKPGLELIFSAFFC